MENKTLILGVGNIYRKDDGIGPIVIEQLRKESISNADLLNGSIDGLAVFEYLKGYKKAIIIDAARMNSSPGEIKIFSPHDAKLNIKSDALSTHGFGLSEALSLVEEFDFDINITIIGIEPADTSFGEGLSKEVGEKIDFIKQAVKKELAANSL